MVPVRQSNVLSDPKRQQVVALGRLGWSARPIQRETGVHRAEAIKPFFGAYRGILVSDRGNVFAEQVMTIAHTARKQNQNELRILTAGCQAQLASTATPSLFAVQLVAWLRAARASRRPTRSSSPTGSTG